MYPPQFIGLLYEEGDLFDTITISDGFGGFIDLDKNIQPESTGSARANDPAELYYVWRIKQYYGETDPTGLQIGAYRLLFAGPQPTTNQPVGEYPPFWYLFLNYPSGAPPFPGPSSSCLIDGSSWYDDLLNGTYNVNSDIVTRDSLCLWKGPKTGGGNWRLFFDSNSQKWELNGQGKTTGSGNSPVGEYPTGTVS
jgi:hypothetical protein